jgi:putative phage-type endonuclease
VTQALSFEGIGASEISAIAGLNPYASPWDVWLRKTGQAPEFEPTPQTEWGHRLEPVIRQAYADQTGATVYVPPKSLFHPEITWARATPDGINVRRSGDWEAIVQCKNVGTWVEKAWSDAPPAYVQLQEQWELLVTNLQRADVAVLIGGSDFRIYTVHRDDKMIADLVTIASDFWRKVETRTPPKVDASDACRDHFERRLAKREPIELLADGDLTEWQKLTREAKRIDREVERIRNVIRGALADAGAERVVSIHGTPFVKPRAGKTVTDWRLIAEMLGSTKCTADEFKTLVAANTETAEPTITLYAPKSWAKESA